MTGGACWSGSLEDYFRLLKIAYRNVKAADTHTQYTDTTGSASVAVGAQQRYARFGKPFKINLVTDAVARRREHGADLGGHTLKIAVIVRVFKSHLGCLVINTANAQRVLDPAVSKGFKEHESGWSAVIMNQGVIDSNPDLVPR